jgi:hypothetical protein
MLEYVHIYLCLLFGEFLLVTDRSYPKHLSFQELFIGINEETYVSVH